MSLNRGQIVFDGFFQLLVSLLSDDKSNLAADSNAVRAIGKG
jgi:hypothetical protein